MQKKIHATALERFDIASAIEVMEQREECLSDRRFHTIRGASWDGAFGEQFENRVKLEFNFVTLAVQRLVSEARMNRITVDFLSRDGDEGDALADLCDGLYRADEQDSRAEEAYDMAFEEAAGGGFGAWRLYAEYEDEYDEDNDYQRIRFEPIPDADVSVFFDTNAKRQDKSDARYCFVIQGMTHEAYEAEFDDPIVSFEQPIETQFDWITSDLVYIAEYYEVEDVSYKCFFYQSLTGEEEKYTEYDFEADDTLKSKLRATGWKKTSEKTVKKRAIHKYILSGSKVLEDCGIIAGSEIPIVPVYGKRSYIQGIERCSGLVRFAKDPSRLNNMQISTIANTAARSGISKPIFLPEQIARHADAWSRDAVDDYAFLQVDAITGANNEKLPSGPVAFTQPPQLAPATAALVELSREGIRDILGNQESGEQVETELSGKAMQLVQSRLDMQHYIYMSNFAKAVKRCGTIWLGMARELYVEPKRRMKSLGEDGGMQSVTLGEPILDNEGFSRTADLSRAKFDVIVDVGPASSSSRSATVTALSNLLPLVTDPQDQMVVQSTIFRNMEGEGISTVREYFRKKLVALGIEEPTDEDLEAAEEAAQQPQPPDPQTEYLVAKAEEAKAGAARDMADVEKTAAETEHTRAETAETIADTQLSQQQLLRPGEP